MDKNDPKIIELSELLKERLGQPERIPPKLGRHDDVPPWDYFQWDAYGSGDVRSIGHSPAHFRAALGKDTAKMIAGRALHACVLEPDTEWLRYHRLPDGTDRRHKAYKEAEQEYGRDFVLTAREYDNCLGGRDALNAHSRISKVLAEGSPEVSFAWEDETGLILKGRSDWINEKRGITIDLKQTGDAREHAFRRVADSMNYPVQGAHYTEGLSMTGPAVRHFAVVAVEVDPPHGVMFYRLSTADMMVAEEHWRALVDKLAWCVERDTWPAYPEETQVLHMGRYWEAGVQEEIARLQESMR